MEKINTDVAKKTNFSITVFVNKEVFSFKMLKCGNDFIECVLYTCWKSDATSVEGKVKFVHKDLLNLLYNVRILLPSFKTTIIGSFYNDPPYVIDNSLLVTYLNNVQVKVFPPSIKITKFKEQIKPGCRPVHSNLLSELTARVKGYNSTLALAFLKKEWLG